MSFILNIIKNSSEQNLYLNRENKIELNNIKNRPTNFQNMTTNPETSSNTSTPSFSIIPIPLSLTHTPSLCRSSASKLDFLYEVNFLNDESKITSEDLPLINPYQAFVKPTTLVTCSIKFLIKRPSRNVKEYVLATKFD